MDGKWPRAQPLATERLDLEPLRPDHAREMARVLDDPALYRYMGGSPPSEAELADSYARRATGFSPDGRQGWLNWVLRLRSDARAVGFVQVTVGVQNDTMNADLAWVVGVKDQGSGVAAEAAAAVTTWLRAIGVAVFTAHIHPDNRASVGVARRLGLVETPLIASREVVWMSRSS